MSDIKNRLVEGLRLVSSAPEPITAMMYAAETEGEYEDRDYLEAVGFITIDDVTDRIVITTAGRNFAGLRPEDVMELPVEVAEMTGNITESELLARYLEGKVAGIDAKIGRGDAPQHDSTFSWAEGYQHVAVVLSEAANEVRQGLHIPPVIIEGKVIPYNEDRDTGIRHADPLRTFFQDVYARNVKAGWWTNIEDGTPKKRNVGELFILMVTELAEAYRAYALGLPDDKLTHHPGLGVEMGDLLIRVADFCGALHDGNIIEYDPGSYNPGAAMFREIVEVAERYEAIRKTPAAKGDTERGEFIGEQDVAVMVDEKLDFNANRADHKIENRLKEDGKRT